MVALSHGLQVGVYLANGHEVPWNRIRSSALIWSARGLLAAAVAYGVHRWNGSLSKRLVWLSLAAAVLVAIPLQIAFSAILLLTGLRAPRAEGFLENVISSRWAGGATMNAIFIISGALVAWGLLARERARRRELEAWELATRLSEARLQLLRLQLRPHFLFNSLNAIAAFSEEAPEAAAAMTRRLRNIFEASLQQDDAQLIELGEDLSLALDYLEIQKTRFGERLAIQTMIDERAHDVLVPHFLLQPLVENAVQHGLGRTLGKLTLTIRATVDDEHLHLEVEDDGAGSSDSAAIGIGLGNTRTRLEQLFAGGASLIAERPADGGFRVHVRVPITRKEVA